MAWDAAAQTMAVNVIAKVESGGGWDAINYNDPITIGLMQWYGTRAAGLLNNIKADHPTEYAAIAASLRADLDAYPESSSFWPKRYLSAFEGTSLKPVLRASKDTQGALISFDIDDYKDAAIRIGIDVESNTNTAIFFCVMYHQSPRQAQNLMKRLGMSSSMSKVYQASLNDGVFYKYKTRYTQAYNIINSGVPPTLIDLNNDNNELGDDNDLDGIGQDSNGHDSIFDTVQTSVKRVEIVGDNIHLHMPDGNIAVAVPSGGYNYLIKKEITGGTVPDEPPGGDEFDPNPDPNPDPPTGDEAEDTRRAIVKFMTDRIEFYDYSQAPGRLTPDKTGYADCSGLTRYAYLSVTGKDIGTYTDAQVTSRETRLILKGGGGNTPDESKMKLGDLVISARYGTAPGRLASHVEIYMGNNRIIGHGGPMSGPIIKPLDARTADKKTWWIKRLNSL